MIKHLIKIDGELFEIPLKVYNHLEQQKQRADELENHVKNLEMDSYLSRERADIYKNKVSELEKRWKKLKEHFVKEKEQSFGILSWSRNNGVLELIERLEENNNA
ncbi:Uncharacterised protein [Macrococcoides caseolyticum]|uniref:hypothetical protein n=1 Tax=Macrococcoides caseolyticum TaxID=69966 RepID=UPI0011712593|nr:hypothetical protein [Macrococcus caseolyticus]VUC68934.1 Uncharacterised protein [Macrococcus caseolyticus]